MARPGRSTEEWIKAFKQVHGEKYDYSDFKYVNARTKSKIICEHHGVFSMVPPNHENGQGCSTCKSIFYQQGRDKKEILVEEGTRIHGGRYSYAKSRYRGALKKTIFTCVLHGDFEQTPQDHIVEKHGCNGCAKIQRSATRIARAGLSFPDKAKAIHGDLYDYSAVEYTGAHDNVTIGCQQHGNFSQTPTNHLSGKGCSKCKGGVALEVPEWKRRARDKHGDKYDYDHVEFTSVANLVHIECHKHGPFQQRAFLHLACLIACPKCRPVKPWTKKRFVDSAREVHDNYYEYKDLPEKISYDTPIAAVCPSHGEWTIPSAGTHASGPTTGCPDCGQNKAAAARRVTQEMVKDQFKESFGDKYKFSKIEFTNPDTPIRFHCPIHGPTSVLYSDLYKGDGCIDCREIVHTEERLEKTERFIFECQAVHQDEYDYSETIYRSSFSRIIVNCRKHGSFKQAARDHSGGRGCAGCANYGYDPKAPSTFYYARINIENDKPLWMIGITKNSFEQRYTEEEHEKMELLKEIKFETGQEALMFEKEVKQKYQTKRYYGESPLKVKRSTELFVSNILKSV